VAVQAVRVHEGGTLVYETVPDPVPAAGEVLVELRCAALNRRDSFVAQGVYPFPLPLVPGSDGSGVRRDTGEEIVVYPGFGWPPGHGFPPAPIGILGGPRDGTFAELVALPAENLYPKPARFSWEEAAAFPLASLTAFRALFTRARLQPSETVLVLGAGSGVSTFAVQLAAQAMARVLVTSSSDEKIDRAKELGAEWGVNYTSTPDWPAAVQERGGADVVIDAIGATWQQSLDCVRLGGRVVVFGATGGTEVSLQVRPFYFGQHSLLGTMLGGPDDMAALLRLVGAGSWRPVIDTVHSLAEAPDAVVRMASGAQFGKLVLTCS
jgi:zinc-binding alcohol dehydrogenase/oxidoreductase